ncbi:GDSL esterase/lipase At1g28580-like isoform X1 [Salvia miltiorrhiza]|uniref:GDSL esterase/lipase At1g28580-like isoform X1 n=1 Tax=Salvia miltiorrhiza TaxID=226208 RepID=UPI0025AC86CB|nr:GDSL esterase/lipase At1g28580-like isoform X1 [Salvia miltiorrhiza]
MVALAATMLTLIAVLSSSASSESAAGCFESIISFGDSLADTGNYPLLCGADCSLHFVLPPYGRTFFHRLTGRCSDGRLVIDFIAQSLGLPLVQPYIAGGECGRSFSKGVNFAVIAATALDFQFDEKIGFTNAATNVSLGTQLDRFKQFLATIPDGRKFLQKSLVLMGEIGGNDYNHPIIQGSTLEAIQPLVSLVIGYIGSTIEELIKLGAETLLVPGNLPIGCLPIYLTEFKASSSAQDYDPKTGCLNWLNDFAIYHNQLLQNELNRIRQLYSHTLLIYADYYNAALRFYLSPSQFGFSEELILSACCGSGGPYNYNDTALCGIPPASSCDDPASYAGWDGIHFTEAAYRLIAQGLLHGPYTIPHITTACPSLNTDALLYEYS